MNTITDDTQAPNSAQKEYWASFEFQYYLMAKARWEEAHEAYAKMLGKSGKAQYDAASEKDGLRKTLEEAAEESRRALAVCRALPIHKEAFGW